MWLCTPDAVFLNFFWTRAIWVVADNLRSLSRSQNISSDAALLRVIFDALAQDVFSVA